MTDCIFCRILRGEIPSATVHRTATVTAFRDISPAAPVHVLIVPNAHIDHIRDPHATSGLILAEMFAVANEVAAQEGIAGTGYRLLINYGSDANLTVPHLHMHVLGGRPLGPMVMPAP